jgi:hypothetical protein
LGFGQCLDTPCICIYQCTCYRLSVVGGEVACSESHIVELEGVSLRALAHVVFSFGAILVLIIVLFQYRSYIL